MNVLKICHFMLYHFINYVIKFELLAQNVLKLSLSLFKYL